MDWHWISGRRTGPPGADWRVDDDQVGAGHPLQAWARSGCGYQVAPYPVALEPPLPILPSPDGFAGHAHGSYNQEPAHTPRERRYLSLVLPEEQRVTPDSVAHFLHGLSGLRFPMAFEILGDRHSVEYGLVAAAEDADGVASQFVAQFPHSEIEEGEDRLRSRLEPLRGAEVGYYVVDFGLYHAFYQTIRRFSRFEADPLAGIMGALGSLGSGEVGGYQVLFSACHRDWGDGIRQVLLDPNGLYALQEAREEQSRARAKISHPLGACVVRVFAVSIDGDDEALRLCQRIGGPLSALSEPGSNSLVALDDDDYPEDEHFRDVLERQSRRAGMVLSTAEVAGLLHPPCESLSHPRLKRLTAREAPLPVWLVGAKGVRLGVHPERDRSEPVAWPDAMRTRHAYLVGGTRMGKSTLLLNLIQQDLEAGAGLCVIDPHGDLARDVLGLIPKARLDDVLYVNLGDRDFPLALNLLGSVDEEERGLLCSDVLSVLRRVFSQSWGDRLEHILRFSLLTLLASPGHTLRDVRRLLSDEGYRRSALTNVRDPDILTFWHGEFADYSPTVFAPIHNKLGVLLGNPTLRNIVAQKECRLDLADAMARRRVLIVNLCQGELGEDAAHLLGALLVSRIQIAAMRGLRKERSDRVPFTLYVDEFQHFLVSSFEQILSEAGKVQLSLVMANQFLGQLSPTLERAVLGNVGTLVTFRVGIDDARRLEKELGARFRSEDLLSLGRGEAILRVGSADEAFRLSTSAPPARPSVNFEARIVAQTRAELCRPRTEVENEILADSLPRSEPKEEPTTRAPATRSVPTRPPKTLRPKPDEPETFIIPE